VHVPEGLTALDLDIIKLTSQMTARNGKNFLQVRGGGARA
jgi:splicing factor 3A subunit 1